MPNFETLLCVHYIGRMSSETSLPISVSSMQTPTLLHQSSIHSFFLPHTESESQYVGFDPVDRSNLDLGPKWTFVSKEPFPSDGHVRAIEFFVGAVNRPIHFGIYEDTGTAGQFKLLQQVDYLEGFTDLGFRRVNYLIHT
jgi:hypothetical protein